MVAVCSMATNFYFTFFCLKKNNFQMNGQRIVWQDFAWHPEGQRTPFLQLSHTCAFSSKPSPRGVFDPQTAKQE